MKASAEEYEQLFNCLKEAVYVQDEQGVFLAVNDAVLTMYGYARDEIVGQTPLILADPAQLDMDATNALVERAFAGDPQTFEWWGKRKNGEIFPKEVTLEAGVFGGRRVVIAMAQEISERQQADARLQAATLRQAESERLRALGQLAAGVAHDFNNALTAILGFADAMTDRVGDAKFMLRGLDIIQQAGRGAAATVRRIQVFARDRRLTEMRALDMSRVVAEAVEMTRPRWDRDAGARGVPFEVVVTRSDETMYVTGNDGELREVIVNLIFNAVDAMPDGGVIEVETRGADDQVVVEVRDHGDGISAEALKKIFEPFFSTKGAEGTGLGLSVSHGIIRRHGGEIVVESELGEGSAFSLELPRYEGTQDAPRRPTARPRPARVLLIDDEDLVRAAMVVLLERFSMDVRAVDDPVTALELLEDESYDLIITDLSMPLFSGAAVVQIVRERHPNTKVIVVTGYATEAELENELKDADKVLHKPPDPEVLARALVEVLGADEDG